MAFGLLIVRLVAGLIMAAHGAQKLFGWFGGYGLTGTGRFFDGLGFRPGAAFAAAAGTGEVASGLLIALGLFGPIGPGLMISVMVVAILSVHAGNGLFAASNGMELPLLYAAVAAALAFTGYGAYSLDALAGLGWLSNLELSGAVVLAGIAGGLLNMAFRHRVPAVA
jgi:putative oxidoreductase